MNNPKISVVTTFPNKYWDLYASQMISTFCKHWPIDVGLWVQLDEEPRSIEVAQQLQQGYEKHFSNRIMDGCTSAFPDELKALLERNKGIDWGKDYRKQYVKFAHKVFAIWMQWKDAVNQGFDYLIWMDADILTTKPVTWDAIKSWLPQGKCLSYLGRKDWNHTETGFIVFDLKSELAEKVLNNWINYYLDDSLLKEPEWHDAFAFDLARNACGVDIGRNLTEGLPGRDIFDVSPLAEYMTHYKGPRKHELKKQPQGNGAVNVDNMVIKTKNCLPDDSIKENVSANLLLIEEHNWLKQVKPHNEEIVIVSAGPSLSPDDIMPYYKRGVKIVAVKHAMETLLQAGIVPWACILLDPRSHVSGFVENPHPDVLYFVSSMVDPEVTRTLLKNRCKVYGYHAFVGAGENTRIPKWHTLVQGGSATATRGISLLDMLGFRKMHLFAYDCCYLDKPDMTKLDEKGRPKYLEMTLSARTWGGREIKRTFWTEGQFLAQVDEMRKIYFTIPGLELTVHGEGIIPWMQRNEDKYKSWGKWMNDQFLEKEHKGVALYDLVPEVNEAYKRKSLRQQLQLDGEL